MSTNAFWDLVTWAHKNREYLKVKIRHNTTTTNDGSILSFQDKHKHFDVRIAIHDHSIKRIKDSDKSEDHAIWDEVKLQSERAVLHLIGGKMK